MCVFYGCTGCFLAEWTFFSCGKQELLSGYDEQASYCSGLSCCGAQSLGLVGSVAVAVSPAACGTFPDQGSNPCPLHWQVDLLPLNHQGSPSEETLCLSLMKGWEEFPLGEGCAHEEEFGVRRENINGVTTGEGRGHMEGPPSTCRMSLGGVSGHQEKKLWFVSWDQNKSKTSGAE